MKIQYAFDRIKNHIMEIKHSVLSSSRKLAVITSFLAQSGIADNSYIRHVLAAYSSYQTQLKEFNQALVSVSNGYLPQNIIKPHVLKSILDHMQKSVDRHTSLVHLPLAHYYSTRNCLFARYENFLVVQLAMVHHQLMPV